MNRLFKKASILLSQEDALLDAYEHPIRTLLFDLIFWTLRTLFQGALFAVGAISVARFMGAL